MGLKTRKTDPRQLSRTASSSGTTARFGDRGAGSAGTAIGCVFAKHERVINPGRGLSRHGATSSFRDRARSLERFMF